LVRISKSDGQLSLSPRKVSITFLMTEDAISSINKQAANVIEDAENIPPMLPLGSRTTISAPPPRFLPFAISRISLGAVEVSLSVSHPDAPDPVKPYSRPGLPGS
jgi:hypothetical protein